MSTTPKLDPEEMTTFDHCRRAMLKTNDLSDTARDLENYLRGFKAAGGKIDIRHEGNISEMLTMAQMYLAHESRGHKKSMEEALARAEAKGGGNAD